MPSRAWSLPLRSLEVLGVRVDDVTYVEALVHCQAFIHEGGPHLVATVNTEFVMAAQRDDEFRRVLNGAALAVPDGVGLLSAARLAGHPLREHVRGTDMVDQLACLAAVKGYRLFLLGGRGGAAEEAGAVLRQRWPGLVVAGCFEGCPDPACDEETVAAVRAAGPVDIVLVAYGAPAQEKWIARTLGATGAAVGVGVGGVFNFFAGRSPEWLFRLLTEPWRWRRQLALARFVLTCLKLGLAGRTVVREVSIGRALGGDSH